ncbi:MAG: hypothetical protein Q7T55_24805 [Solirubrobacteraceae bacterium]|nr:hypothetical protein [Solirubrobacteraceae bacterium]
MTIADVQAVAPVETYGNGEGKCWARVPSLELALRVESASPSDVGCRNGKVTVIFSTGPGIATTDRGLQALHSEAQARAAFPRLVPPPTTDRSPGDGLPLAGYAPLATPWQTVARMSVKDRIIGFWTAPSPPR